MKQLSAKGLQILKLRAAGLTIEQVAQICSISKYTVQTHIRRVYARLGAQSLLEALERVETVHPDFRTAARTTVHETEEGPDEMETLTVHILMPRKAKAQLMEVLRGQQAANTQQGGDE